MGELVAGKYLSNRSEYHDLFTGDNTAMTPVPEGKCAGTPKNYNLVCKPTPTPCGQGGGQTQQPLGIAAAAGDYHSLRILGGGTVWTTGTTTGFTRSLLQVKGPGGAGVFDGAKAVAAGGRGRSSLALKNDGTVWAWGENLGTGASPGTGSVSPTPVQVKNKNGSEFTNVIAIALGQEGTNTQEHPVQSKIHALALKDDGTVWAWGDNTDGKLGDDTTNNSTTPVRVKGTNGSEFGDVAAIDAGRTGSLALKKDGTVWGWGDNDKGNLGDGTTNDRKTPVQVKNSDGNISDVTAISTDNFSSAALKRNGTVWMWGEDLSPYINRASYESTGRYTPGPVEMQGLGDVTAIAMGDRHILASKSGEVWAWGANVTGQLGDGSTKNSATPVQVSGFNGVGSLVGATALAAGHGFSMAVLGDGRVLAWGTNFDGQLGVGEQHGPYTYTVPVGPYPPVNDAFAAGEAITGAKGDVRGTNRSATTEAGEPSHNPPAAGEDQSAKKSVWYRWTAPAGAIGIVTFTTEGSGSAGTYDESAVVNTTMGVYTGTTVSSLTTVAQNNDSPPGYYSQVTFQAVPGVEYHIAIDGTRDPTRRFGNGLVPPYVEGNLLLAWELR